MVLNLRTFTLIMLTVFAISGRAEVLPDPTRPSEFQATLVIQDLPKELMDWKVTAIRISQNDRTAIVNDGIVRAGDTIGPARVLEIQATQVILDYDNRQVAVRLFGDLRMRTPVSNNIKTESNIR